MPAPEILELTSLRFIAALHVVVYHAFPLAGVDAPRWLTPLVHTGFISVGFFFVLSGFILSYAHCDPISGMRTPVAVFARSRFARLYPVYLLSFFLDAPRAIGYFVRSEMPGKALVAGLAYLSMMQAWVPRLAVAWNPAGWSLSDEVFFYALFPFFASVLWRISSGWVPYLTAGMAVAPVALSWTLTHKFGVWNGGPEWRSFGAYHPLVRFPEFLFGMAVGRLYFLHPKTRNGTQLVAFGLAGILYFLYTSGDYPPLVLHNGLLAPCHALVIYGLASGAGVRSLSSPWLIYLGRASYCLYLLHEPILNAVSWLAESTSQARSPMLFTLALVCTVGISLAAYRWFEEPMRRRLAPRPFEKK